ncbi:MAG: putative NAD(P)H-dependent FMN-containing oxidoreductase YwqN [Syntrophorhabdus sp. PtaU1.Bin058]|nr:MAG: putative NAD(P)H-dependent FMN-containing oxidoreductase YwqN [Syntrophorhabdus sp. PtaU1.Bin058]
MKDTIEKPKRILGLIGSPRKTGNCELITKEISRHITVPHTLRLIRLPSLNILPCKACYGCIMDNPCPLNDDMGFLLQEIVQADAVIMASPIYFLGANAIFKKILDRGFLFFDILHEVYKKPSVLVNLYGMNGRIGVAPQMLLTFAAFLGFDIKASVDLKAALPGEVIMNPRHMNTAKRLGTMLFSEKRAGKGPGCPFCGCEFVRMKKNSFICTLCSGRFSIDKNGVRVKIREGEIFGTPEHRLLHKEWLRGMKDRFLGSRKEILQAASQYKDIGEWVTP